MKSLFITILLFGSCTSLSSQASDLRVICTAGGRTLLLAGATPKQVLVRDGDQVIPAPADAQWRLEGDLREHVHTISWLLDYTIRRPVGADAMTGPAGYGVNRSRTIQRRPDADALIDPTYRTGVTLFLQHGRGLNSDGESVPSQVLHTWPKAFTAPPAIVFLWLVGDEIAHVDVQPIPIPENYLQFTLRSQWNLTPDDASRCRAGVAAFVDGAFCTPAPAFTMPAGQLALAASVFDDAALYDQAVNSGATADMRARSGKPLVLIAAQMGAVQVLDRMLTANPALAALAAPNGETPLHLAAYYSRAEMISRLLQTGIAPDPQKKNGYTPLAIAAAYGHLAALERLIEGKADVNLVAGSLRPPMFDAMGGGSAAVAARLVAAGAKLPKDPGDVGNFLFLAAGNGQTEIVEWLLGFNDARVVKLGGDSALFAAAERNGDFRIAQLLLKAGVSPDATNGQGRTALHTACEQNSVSFANVLINGGATLSVVDADRNTPLHVAAKRDHPEIARLLVERGADLNSANKDKLRPLDLALLGCAADTARVIAQAGGKVDLRGPRAASLLEAAIRLNCAEVVRTAVQEGWSPDTLLASSWPALRVAEVCGADDVASSLRQAGAKPLVATPVEFVHASDLDVTPRLLEGPSPIDPRDSDDRREPLTLTAGIIIDATGHALFPQFGARSHDGNYDKIVATLSKWRFTPPTRNGKPAATRVTIPIQFNVKLDRPFNLSEVDDFPQAVLRVEPEFPPEVRGPDGSIEVEIRVNVTERGVVDPVRVLRESRPKAGEAAIVAVRQWRFTPAKRHGKPVAVQLDISFAPAP